MSDELSELQAHLQAASDEIAGHVETIRRQSGVIGKLRREDPEKKLREHADWHRGHTLFKTWQRATGRTRTRWTTERFRACMPYLAEYEDELIVRAITGIAYDPFTTRQKNGLEEKHDGWHTLFKSTDSFERFANKAPLNWHDTLEAHAEEVAAKS